MDLNNEEWTPIGEKEGTAFCGEFNGNGKTISGLNIDKTQVVNDTSEFAGYYALFGHISTGTNIYDLTVSGSVNAPNAAGVVAYMDGGQLLTVNNEVAVQGTKVGNGKAGGVVCLANGTYCTITDCKNNGEISEVENGRGSVGGIVAYVNGPVTIESCYNHAIINAPNGTNVGGIIGYTDPASQPVTVIGCFNRNLVTGGKYVGGIVGAASSPESTYYYCDNSGKITAREYAGGIAGAFANATATECTNAGDMVEPTEA